MIFKLSLFIILFIPLIFLQGIIFIFGGWTMDKYTRPNIVFGFMDWLDI